MILSVPFGVTAWLLAWVGVFVVEVVLDDWEETRTIFLNNFQFLAAMIEAFVPASCMALVYA